VKGNPSLAAPPLNASLAIAPSSPSSISILQISGSPSVEQAFPRGDLLDWLAADQGSSQASPRDGLQASPIMETSSDGTESADAASELSGAGASRDAAFSVTPAFAVRNRTATSALDEFFAGWGAGIEAPDN
jgi:hypothetical protein